MAWETRGNGSYYYRKVRDGGRVRSVYVGAGLWAEAEAIADEVNRETAAAGRAAWSTRVQAEQADDEAIAAAGDVAQTLTAAVLIAAGCYTHRRQWRRRQ